jgi:hypothetical protein
MTPDSITERQFTRRIHFENGSREEALKQTIFYQEQIAFYLANVFTNQNAYDLECSQRHDTDRVYTIRKGSAVLTVTTVFGINTSYKEQPPRKFYTFTATTTHRNEVLDNTGKTNDFIEWVFRITGGVILGGFFAIMLALFGGHLGLHSIILVFTFGSAVGGFAGEHLARKIYNRVESRLEQKGEITEIESDWTLLKETVEMVFAGVPSRQAGLP